METFLNAFNWRGRCEGYRDTKTDEGQRALSFVVKNYVTHRNARGYYVAGRRSATNSGRLICHVKDIGYFKNTSRRTGMVPARGCSTLGEWVSTNFFGVHTILFD